MVNSHGFVHVSVFTVFVYIHYIQDLWQARICMADYTLPSAITAAQ